MPSLYEYEGLLNQYRADRPFDNTGTQYSVNDLVSGSQDTLGTYDQLQYTNDMKLGAEWMKTLSPEQQAEYQQLYDERHAEIQAKMRRNRMIAAAAVAAVGGAGALTTMGGLGGGAAAGAEGLAAADIAGGLIPEFGTSAGYAAGIGGAEAAGGGLGMASWMDGAPAWGGTGGSAAAGSTGGSMWANVPEYIKSLVASAAKNAGGNWLSQLISSGTNAYMGNRSAGQYNDVLNEINALYSPNSPYALQMKQALARKDAAAGRNSQYGTREVELAAALTNSKANALTSAGYGNLMNQRGISQNIPWNGFLAALGSGPGQELITKAGGNIGGWLGGLFGNSGDKLVPTQPNSTPNWWENWGGYTNGGP